VDIIPWSPFVLLANKHASTRSSSLAVGKAAAAAPAGVTPPSDEEVEQFDASAGFSRDCGESVAAAAAVEILFELASFLLSLLLMLLILGASLWTPGVAPAVGRF
jgi:hypothetical protein